MEYTIFKDKNFIKKYEKQDETFKKLFDNNIVDTIEFMRESKELNNILRDCGYKLYKHRVLDIRVIFQLYPFNKIVLLDIEDRKNCYTKKHINFLEKLIWK